MHYPGMARDPVLTAIEWRFVAETRRAVLATTDRKGRPRLVPICHVAREADDRLERPVLYTPIDEKPKRSTDPMELARVRDLMDNPEVVVLVDRWDEDWSRLGWLRVDGTARIIQPDGGDRGEHALAIAALRAKYRQYVAHRLEDRPIIRIEILRARAWGSLELP